MDIPPKDLKKCTLVCFTWCKQFRPFLWESLYYSRLEIDPALKRHGPLIRQLYTHSLQDKDLRSIAKLCPNLTGIELEIESLQDPGSIFEVFASVSHSLQRLTIRLLNPSSTGNVQRALLEPIAWGRLSLLTELRLMGFGYDCYAPLYTTGMLLRCVEGCPLLETLEISGVRLVQSQSQWDAVVQKAFNNTNRNALESNVRPLPQQGQQQVNASFWRSYKKTNILGRLVAAVLPSAPSQQESGATPATFTSTLDTPQSPTSPTSPAASSASALPHSPATVLPVPVEVETIEPLRDYTCKFLRTLKLSDIFTDTKTGMAFTSELLNRCPNLAYLYLKVAPVELQDLAILCPKLRTFAVENYQEYTMTYPQPPLSAYLNPRSLEGLHDDHTLLMALRSVKLNHCVIRDEELTAIHQDFKRYRLKHLQITNCFSITSLGLARFLAECWALESLWVDRLLLPVVGTNVLAHRSRSRSVGDGGQPGTTGTSNGSGAGSVVHVNPNAIQWGCGQIRKDKKEMDLRQLNQDQESMSHFRSGCSGL
ncbi:hypothetical protein EDD11_009005 [Mortierella claussenii]|nr:hypothetical protein EDD11_009005 [Mortierella claussenii]